MRFPRRYGCMRGIGQAMAARFNSGPAGRWKLHGRRIADGQEDGVSSLAWRMISSSSEQRFSCGAAPIHVARCGPAWNSDAEILWGLNREAAKQRRKGTTENAESAEGKDRTVFWSLRIARAQASRREVAPSEGATCSRPEARQRLPRLLQPYTP